MWTNDDEVADLIALAPSLATMLATTADVLESAWETLGHPDGIIELQLLDARKLLGRTPQ